MGSKTKQGPLHEMEAHDAFAFWGIDWVGPLPETTSGNKYLLNAVDCGTSLGIAIPHSARSGGAVVRLLEKIKYAYGKPLQILTDNGAEFLGDKVQVYLRRNLIQYFRTTPGHPQTNGKVQGPSKNIRTILKSRTRPSPNKLQFSVTQRTHATSSCYHYH